MSSDEWNRILLAFMLGGIVCPLLVWAVAAVGVRLDRRRDAR